MNRPELQERFEALLQGHRGILHKVCRAYGATAADREDLAQEIVIQLWRSFGTFDELRSFPTWMYRIALNVALSHRRRESIRARRAISDDDDLLEVVDKAEPPNPDLARLHEIIGDLDPLNKALLLLHLDGHSHHEVAEILGLSESNVGTKLSRLKQAMKHSFARSPKWKSMK